MRIRCEGGQHQTVRECDDPATRPFSPRHLWNTDGLQQTTRPTTRLAIHAGVLWRSTADTQWPKRDNCSGCHPLCTPPIRRIVFSLVTPPFKLTQRRSININCVYRVYGEGSGTRVSVHPRLASLLSSAALYSAFPFVTPLLHSNTSVITW